MVVRCYLTYQVCYQAVFLTIENTISERLLIHLNVTPITISWIVPGVTFYDSAIFFSPLLRVFKIGQTQLNRNCGCKCVKLAFYHKNEIKYMSKHWSVTFNCKGWAFHYIILQSREISLKSFEHWRSWWWPTHNKSELTPIRKERFPRKNLFLRWLNAAQSHVASE